MFARKSRKQLEWELDYYLKKEQNLRKQLKSIKKENEELKIKINNLEKLNDFKNEMLDSLFDGIPRKKILKLINHHIGYWQNLKEIIEKLMEM